MNQTKHAYTRLVGSQSEIPIIEQDDNNSWSIRGYQEYRIVNSQITSEKHEHKIKFNAIKPYIPLLLNKSFIDIGCSSGYFGVQSIQNGAAHVTFLDHDHEYLELLNSVLRILNIKNTTICRSKISEYQLPHDVGIAFALIHWIYSYSDCFGSLDSIVGHLHKLASHTLFVEWVDPSDYAMDLAGHIYQNPDRIAAPYDKKLFLDALRKRYTTVLPLERITETREIYMATTIGLEEILSITSSGVNV